jgi:hypothetical protein
MVVRTRQEYPGWPQYEVVSVELSPEVPSNVVSNFTEISVPRRLIGYEYRVLERATIAENAAGANLVAFGSSGSRGLVCIDVDSGRIVHLPLRGVPQINGVNDNIQLFRGCVRAVIERFPFYNVSAESEEYQEVADDIRNIINEIDASALMNDGFWQTFTDDVEIGDYATEFIVG